MDARTDDLQAQLETWRAQYRERRERVLQLVRERNALRDHIHALEDELARLRRPFWQRLRQRLR